MSTLRDAIIAFFEAGMVEEVLVLPFAKQGLIGEVAFGVVGQGLAGLDALLGPLPDLPVHLGGMTILS